MDSFFKGLLSLFQAGFEYLFTAVSGAFNVILSEVPDDEIAIMHGAMDLATQKMHAGATTEETWTAVLNFVAASELQELSKVGDHMLQAFIHGLDAARTP